MKSIFKSIGYIIVFVLFQLIVSVLFSALAISGGASNEKEIAEYIANNILLITIISNFVTLVTFIMFRKVRKQPKIKLFVFRNIAWKDCMLCAITAFAFSMCFSLITYNIQFENAQLISKSTTYYSQSSSLFGTSIMVVALLLSAPITEEYICRGLLFSEMQKKFSPVATVILSGVIFGVIHIFAGGIILAIGATLMGLLFGYVYWKTKSLTVAVIAHICANLPDFIFRGFTGLNMLIITIMTIVFLTVGIGCLLYFHKHQQVLVS